MNSRRCEDEGFFIREGDRSMAGNKGRASTTSKPWMRSIVLAGAISATAMSGIARAAEPAATSEPTQQQLLDEVRALRAEVEALKAKENQPVASHTAPATTPVASSSESSSDIS